MKVVKGISEEQHLRQLREKECFSIVNRGKLWYNCLTDEQLTELTDWYFAWLDVTKTKVIPIPPAWLNDKLEKGEQIW